MLLALAVVAALRVDLASAQTFVPGTQARVTADGDTLRMRAGVGLDKPVIASIPDGSIVNIRDGSQAADGYTWQFIDWNGAIGWVASEFLTPLGATATPSPTASPTTTSTTPTPTPSATVTPTPSPTTPPSASAGVITGNLPPTGKAGLIVWGGGSMDSLVVTAAGRGCNVRSIYAVKDGRFVGYTPGAPAFVNASWVSQIGDINSVAALLVFCDAPGQTSNTSGGTSGGTSGNTGPSTVGSATAPPSSETRPPGPGGNES
ncbi:MAG: SH3 domain-containing protein [Dehalococcoidia bacterium]|nr:SH3 domain-containing protein [Dehalococcoidia bacterium]